MKLILFFVISCLALHNGKGAPRTAVYNYVRCNPEGDQANCVTHQTPEMAWSPDLPAKLPASTAQYLEAEPVEDEGLLNEGEDDYEDESPLFTEDGQQTEGEEEYEDESPVFTEGGRQTEGEEEYEDESPVFIEEGESPVVTLSEEGSGAFEGSAAEDIPMADRAFVNAESETGSGESWTEKDEEPKKGGDMKAMRWLFPSRSLAGEAKPEERDLREDHLLQL